MKHYENSVGGNAKHIQLTTKYRYKMFGKEKLKVFCRVAIEEACKRYKIEIIVLEIMPEHVHCVADVPRTMCDAKALQLIKGFSSYLLFRLCPDLRKRYPRGNLWNEGYFCEGVGSKEFGEVLDYVKNQEEHHSF